MDRNKYLDDVHEASDGGRFVVLEAEPGRELRGRRTRDGIRIETWARGEAIELSAEAVARLHALVDLPGSAPGGEGR